ncbi:hypothetical protein RJ641_036942 [Dillenia turbinata]|uniref:Uncharacterized protein n=1 Tax=Dillenia turbinata TaxID=194707 RepID=A0AAN8VU38_9MAGN
MEAANRIWLTLRQRKKVAVETDQCEGDIWQLNLFMIQKDYVQLRFGRKRRLFPLGQLLLLVFSEMLIIEDIVFLIYQNSTTHVSTALLEEREKRKPRFVKTIVGKRGRMSRYTNLKEVIYEEENAFLINIFPEQVFPRMDAEVTSSGDERREISADANSEPKSGK